MPALSDRAARAVTGSPTILSIREPGAALGRRDEALPGRPIQKHPGRGRLPPELGAGDIQAHASRPPGRAGVLNPDAESPRTGIVDRDSGPRRLFLMESIPTRGRRARGLLHPFSSTASRVTAGLPTELRPGRGHDDIRILHRLVVAEAVNLVGLHAQRAEDGSRFIHSIRASRPERCAWRPSFSCSQARAGRRGVCSHRTAVSVKHECKRRAWRPPPADRTSRPEGRGACLIEMHVASAVPGGGTRAAQSPLR